MLSNIRRSQPHRKTVKQNDCLDELYDAGLYASSCFENVRKHWQSQWHPAIEADIKTLEKEIVSMLAEVTA